MASIALRTSPTACLFEEGVFALPIVYPMVAKGKARIRTIMNAAMTREDLDFDRRLREDRQGALDSCVAVSLPTLAAGSFSSSLGTFPFTTRKVRVLLSTTKREDMRDLCSMARRTLRFRLLSGIDGTPCCPEGTARPYLEVVPSDSASHRQASGLKCAASLEESSADVRVQSEQLVST